jgi:two-component system nitrogen regulation sensor histidine kinase GlnL
MTTLAESPINLERRVLDHMTTSVFLLDDRLRVRYINPAAEMLFAISQRQIHGHSLGGALDPGSADLLGRHLSSSLDTGQTVTEREVSVVRQDGNALTVDCTLIPLPKREGLAGIMMELQQVDRHLRISRDGRLLSQQQVTRDVVRGLAHEIKNPLGGLRGAAQLLQAELPNRELREYTEIIIQEADRLQNLVNRLLGPNRLPEYQSLNIHSVLERVGALVGAEAGAKLVIERDYDPSIPAVVGDADQLIQAVLNLVRNAARAVQNNGCIVLRSRVLRKFTIGTRRHRLVAQLDVCDDGPGIPEAIKDRLFYPMVTSGTGGLGLGLSIAQSIINQHQGMIECRSAPGETVFTIYLPLEE